MKCPKCGHLADPFATKCPKCGILEEPRAAAMRPAVKPPRPERAPKPEKAPKAAPAATGEKPAKASFFSLPGKGAKADKPAKPAKPANAAKPATPAKAGKPAANSFGFVTDLLNKFGAKGKPKATIKSSTADMPDELSAEHPMEMVGLQATCMKCNKSLWAASSSNVSADEMVQHSMSRAMFCIICQHTYCKQCAHEAGRRKGTNEFLCPKCGKPLTE